MGGRIVIALAAMLCAPSLCTGAAAQDAPLKTVLAITAGTENFPANPIIDAGVRDALAARTDLPIDYFTEYLESDFFPGEEPSLAFRDYIRGKYRGRRIDLVIAMTDPVLKFALDHRAELFPDAPIVFTGIGVPNESVRTAGGGITGVKVGIAYAETLQLALELQPSTKEVFVVAKGREKTVEAVQTELRDWSQRVRLTYLAEKTIPDLLAKVRAAPPGSVILYIWHMQQDPGHVVYADAIARLVTRAASVPVYGTSDFYIGSGVIGGVVRDTRETGTRIGQIAIQILTGTRASDIPIETARTAPILDWRQLRRWGISEAQVPAGTRILFREPGVWDRTRCTSWQRQRCCWLRQDSSAACWYRPEGAGGPRRASAISAAGCSEPRKPSARGSRASCTTTSVSRRRFSRWTSSCSSTATRTSPTLATILPGRSWNVPRRSRTLFTRSHTGCIRRSCS
jgi:ABC-type uncharacterized transport system substrate-binding protein